MGRQVNNRILLYDLFRKVIAMNIPTGKQQNIALWFVQEDNSNEYTNVHGQKHFMGQVAVRLWEQPTLILIDMLMSCYPR